MTFARGRNPAATIFATSGGTGVGDARFTGSDRRSWTMHGSEDITQVDHLLSVRAASDQAYRCRRLARSINDRETAQMLERLAEDYDRRAAALA